MTTEGLVCGYFLGESIVMQIPIVMLIFLLISGKLLGGRQKSLRQPTKMIAEQKNLLK